MYKNSSFLYFYSLYHGHLENYDHKYRAKANVIMYEVSSQECSLEEIKQHLETFLQVVNKKCTLHNYIM